MLRGWKSDCIRVNEISGDWTPPIIAVFYGNKQMLQKLSATSQAALGLKVDDAYLEGERHGPATCDECYHVSP